MKFFLRTAYDNLTQSYGSSNYELPFQGMCQGNGASPTLWLAVSNTLIQMLCSHGNLVTFTAPISDLSISLTSLLYIDNCDLIAFPQCTLLVQHLLLQYYNGTSTFGKEVSACLEATFPSKNVLGLSCPPCGNKVADGTHTQSVPYLAIVMSIIPTPPTPLFAKLSP